jgi:3-hydroxyisobutyrate dehydrogenase-like beta-hydroxyacid dehydrogenase
LAAQVGIVGLGLVGSALAGRLLEQGRSVRGYDTDHARMEALAAAGGTPCDSAAAAAASGTVLLCLPTLAVSKAVVAEMCGELRPGAIVADVTTGSPEETAALERALAGRGVSYVETLIGGSSTLVRAGEAITLCGGDRAAFERLEALLRACFREVFYLGACGNGSRMKLVFNLVLGLNRAVLAEGLAFAEANGIDPAAALPILRAGPAFSRVMDAKGRRMVEHDFQPEARLAQHLKDVRIIRSLGEKTGARLPLTALHERMLEQAVANGHGGDDNSAIICYYTDEASK